MTAREDLHRLIDELPEGEIHAATRFLEFLHLTEGDPLLRALLSAPYDDEPETPEEAAAVKEAWEDVKANHFLTHEELKHRLSKRR